MPLLISGSQRNSSAASGYTNLSVAQNQLGDTPTTSTGFTLIADRGSLARYVSSLGNLNFDKGTVISNLANQNITFIGTGTGTVIISGPQENIGTNTGVLVVDGGIGISKGLHTGEDIHVNGLTIGQGYQGVNNIVIVGVATTITNTNDFDGENNISIGYNSLGSMSSAQGSIAIGAHALSSGTKLNNTIAIGERSLESAGTRNFTFIGTVTDIAVASTGTLVTIPNHGLVEGCSITFTGITGDLGLNLNDIDYLVRIINSNVVSLYNYSFPENEYIYSINSIYQITNGRNIPVDSSNFGSGNFSQGKVYRNIITFSNIAIGTNAGRKFSNGQRNFFIGHNAASSFNTGSLNFFMGYDAVSNLKSGNSNVSIYSNRLQSGQDFQVGIGNVFYYDGLGQTTIGSNLLIEAFQIEDATGPANLTGALRVSGGAGISQSLYVGKNLSVTGTGTVTLSPLSSGTVIIYPSTATGTIDNMIIGSNNAQSSTFFTTVITSNSDSTSSSSGALQVSNGGVGIDKSLYVGLLADVNTANIRSTTAATSTTTGAITVAGGMGVQGSIYSIDGNVNEDNLLYSPKVTVSTSSPITANVGDFWINVNTLAEYQYIVDDGNRFWIQIAQL